MAGADLEPALLTVLRDAGAAGPDAHLDGLRRLSGGASRETWSLDLVDGGATRPLILQRLRPGAGASSTGILITTEAELLRAAGAAGVRVADVVASDDGSTLG